MQIISMNKYEKMIDNEHDLMKRCLCKGFRKMCYRQGVDYTISLQEDIYRKCPPQGKAAKEKQQNNAYQQPQHHNSIMHNNSNNNNN